jgi:exosortase A-associated hydrolase 1
MPCVEEAVSFTCQNDDLIGVLTRPGSGSTSDSGVIIVVGGPQYRVGSHRQFVLLARALGGAGFAVLRFDVRGMGDSSGALRGFEATANDVQAAIDVLERRVPTVRQVTLVGLCDGASAALLYCHERNDGRVRGLCLLNPWVRSKTSLAVTHIKHYYTRRLMQREFWAKLVRGEVGMRAAAAAWRSVRLATSGGNGVNNATLPKSELPYQQRMVDAWNRFQGHILLVLSGDDYTAKEFIEHARHHLTWRGALARGKLELHELVGADHTFSGAETRVAMEGLVVDWLRRSRSAGSGTSAVRVVTP